MGDDQRNTVLPLSDATVVLQTGDQKEALSRELRRSRHFSKPSSSPFVPLKAREDQWPSKFPRPLSWQLTAVFHERSISAVPKQPQAHGKR
jgi:hypothetical protein